MDDDHDAFWRPALDGFGSMHDLSDRDPRNPRLIGLRSVSYAGAVGLAKRKPPSQPRRIGFHRPK